MVKKAFSVAIRRMNISNDNISSEQIGDINNLLQQLLPEDAPREELTSMHLINFSLVSDHVIIIAQDLATKKIVGMATLHLKPLLARGLIGEVEEFVVDEAYRGQGIAGRIHDEIVVAAKKEGVHELRLTSAPWRVIANEFYRRRGYVPYDTNVYRRALP